MTKHKFVKHSNDDMIDLTRDQQNLIHGGLYLLNRKGAVAIDDGNETVLVLRGYDLTALGESLAEVGVPVVQIFTVAK